MYYECGFDYKCESDLEVLVNEDMRLDGRDPYNAADVDEFWKERLDA